MGIAVTVIDDGRPAYLDQAIRSIKKHVTLWPSDRTILINDSGDVAHAQNLKDEYPHFDRQIHHETRRGLAGALRSAWETALEYDIDFILHWECDFVAMQDIPISQIIDILVANPLLSQISLKRQPVNEYEQSAGGFIQTNPSAYYDRGTYVEHRTCFSFNPHLVSRHVAELCLKEPGDGLEHGFTETLLAHGYSFGILGNSADPPRVLHIGKSRASGWKP